MFLLHFACSLMRVIPQPLINASWGMRHFWVIHFDNYEIWKETSIINRYTYDMHEAKQVHIQGCMLCSALYFIGSIPIQAFTFFWASGPEIISMNMWIGKLHTRGQANWFACDITFSYIMSCLTFLSKGDVIESYRSARSYYEKAIQFSILMKISSWYQFVPPLYIQKSTVCDQLFFALVIGLITFIYCVIL